MTNLIFTIFFAKNKQDVIDQSIFVFLTAHPKTGWIRKKLERVVFVIFIWCYDTWQNDI
jgi:hypothetical protein